MSVKKSLEEKKAKHLSYQDETEHNKRVFEEVIQSYKPNLFVLYDLIEKNEVNVYILFKYIRQLINIANGSRYGQVVTIIQDGKVKVIRGEDTDKVDQVIIKPEEQQSG